MTRNFRVRINDEPEATMNFRQIAARLTQTTTRQEGTGGIEMTEQRIGRTEGTREGSEYSHYAPMACGGNHWHVFNIEDCERCGADTEAPNAVGWSAITEVLLQRRLGMKRLESRLPELMLHEATLECYCPECFDAAVAKHGYGDGVEITDVAE